MLRERSEPTGVERESATILGIDAAWTLTQPSGVTVAICENSRWRLAAVAASYQRFLAAADGELVPEPEPSGRMPDIATLLHAAVSG